MKTNRSISLLTALLGAVTLVLRTGLLLLGTDAKGLLSPGNPLDLLTWVMIAATVALIAIVVRKRDGSQKYGDNFAPSVPAAIGAFSLAGGIAVTVLLTWPAASKMELIRNLLGVLAVPALIWVGLCRRKGEPPFFLCHGAVCVYLILYAISHYRPWCSQPQLQRVFFSVAAILLLSLFAYAQTAFDADMGSRRMQLFTGLTAGFCAIAAIPGGEDPLLYLGGAIWALTNLCTLTPVPEEDSHEPA